MNTIYSRNADGNVVRRDYRTPKELAGKEFAQATARARANADYSEADQANIIATAQARFDATIAALEITGTRKRMVRGSVTAIRVGAHVARWLGSAPNLATAGLLPAWEEYTATNSNPEATADMIHAAANELLDEWDYVQKQMAAEWRRGNQAQRLLIEAKAVIDRGAKLKAKLPDTTPAAAKAEAKVKKEAVTAQVDSLDGEAAAYAAAAVVRAERAANERLKAQVTTLHADARQANTITNMKATHMEGIVPGSVPVVVRINDGNWKGLYFDMKEFAAKHVALPSVRSAVATLTSSLIRAYISPKLQARAKFNVQTEFNKLKLGTEARVEYTDSLAKVKAEQGVKLVARAEALLTVPTLKLEFTRAALGKARSWANGSGSESYGSLDKLLTRLEEAATNPRSPAYKG